jgi:hypothetical protein
MAMNSVPKATLEAVDQIFPLHFDKLEKLPVCTKSIHYVFIEAQGNWIEAQAAQRRILERPKCDQSRYIFPSDDPEQARPGKLMNEDILRKMSSKLSTVMRDGTLFWSWKFVSEKPAYEKQEFYKQLKKWRIDRKESKNDPLAAFKEKITGKSPGQCDDRVVCTGTGMLHMTEIRMTRDHERIAELNGLVA